MSFKINILIEWLNSYKLEDLSLISRNKSPNLPPDPINVTSNDPTLDFPKLPNISITKPTEPSVCYSDIAVNGKNVNHSSSSNPSRILRIISKSPYSTKKTRKAVPKSIRLCKKRKYRGFAALENRDICHELVVYLDYDSIISFDTYISKELGLNNYIDIKHSFNAYLKRWNRRKKHYYFDDKIMNDICCGMDGGGCSIYTFIGNDNAQSKIENNEKNMITDICLAAVDKMANAKNDDVDCSKRFEFFSTKYGISNSIETKSCSKSQSYQVIKHNVTGYNDISDLLADITEKRLLKYRDRICKILNVCSIYHRLNVEHMVIKWYFVEIYREDLTTWDRWENIYSFCGKIAPNIISNKMYNHALSKFTDCTKKDIQFFILLQLFGDVVIP